MRNNATSLQKRTGGGAGTTTTAVGGEREKACISRRTEHDSPSQQATGRRSEETAKEWRKTTNTPNCEKNSEITQTHTFTSTPTRNHTTEMAEKRTKTCALTKTTSHRYPIDEKQTHKIDRASQVRTYHAYVHACLSFSAKVEVCAVVVVLLSFRRKARGSLLFHARLGCSLSVYM